MKTKTTRNKTTRKIVDTLGRGIYKKVRQRKAMTLVQKFGYNPENTGYQFDILETNEYSRGLNTYWDRMRRVDADYVLEW